MKLVGVAGREFKVVEDVDPEKLSDLQGSLDFIWVDMESANQRNEKLARDLFGIESLQEGGYPRGIFGKDHDFLLLDYYERLVLKELLVFYSGSFILTVHTGPCSLCDEAIASLNELMISGGLNAAGILYQILSGVLESLSGEITLSEDTVRTLTYEIKETGTDLKRIVALYNGVKRLDRVVSKTRDLIFVTPQESGFIDKPGLFRALYSQAVEQTERTGELFEGLDNLFKTAVPHLFSSMLTQRKALGGLSILAIALGAAALAMSFFPDGLFGLPPMTMILAILALGIIGFFVYQRVGSKLTVR